MLVAAALPASAATVITRSGAPTFFDGGFAKTSFYSSWTQSAGNAYIAVTVAAEICSIGGVTTGTATAFLTNAIGPGTTVANQIATAPVSVTGATACGTSSALTTIFTGLSLPAGTYYLVFSNMNANFGWTQNIVAPTETLGTGVTSNVDAFETGGPGPYPPADVYTAYNIAGATKNFLFSVTGTLFVPPPPPPPTPTATGIPTLSTWGLFGMIILLGATGVLLTGKIPPQDHDSLRPH